MVDKSKEDKLAQMHFLKELTNAPAAGGYVNLDEKAQEEVRLSSRGSPDLKSYPQKDVLTTLEKITETRDETPEGAIFNDDEIRSKLGMQGEFGKKTATKPMTVQVREPAAESLFALSRHTGLTPSSLIRKILTNAVDEKIQPPDIGTRVKLSFKISEPIIEALDAACDQTAMKRSEFMVYLIDRFIEVVNSEIEAVDNKPNNAHKS